MVVSVAAALRLQPVPAKPAVSLRQQLRSGDRFDHVMSGISLVVVVGYGVSVISPFDGPWVRPLFCTYAVALMVWGGRSVMWLRRERRDEEAAAEKEFWDRYGDEDQ